MNTEDLMQCDHMILIGATGRNSGKTTLATNIIKEYKDKAPIIAFKLITVRDQGDICPRGGKGCGICKGLKGGFDIVEEVNEGTKDTMLLKKSGAKHVYLIRALTDHLKEAIEEALTYVPKNSLILCESNSLRHVLKPACFVMIHSNASSEIKPSAQSVMELADIVLEQDNEGFSDFVQNKLPLYVPSNL